MKFLLKNNQGLAAVIIVIIISAAGLIMAYSVAMLGFGEIELSGLSEESGQTLAIAEGCAEESLYRLKKDNDYSGGALSLGEGLCIITVSGAGSSRSILISSNQGYYYKKIELAVSIVGNNIVINSWKELDS